MKKLVTLICLLAIGLFSGDVFALNAPSVQGGEPDNWYSEVQFQAGTGNTIDASGAEHGMVLEWTISTDSGHDAGFTVHIADSADSELVAGIVPTRSDAAHNRDVAGIIKDGDIFIMQIHGLAENLPTASGAAATAGSQIGSEATFGSAGDGDGLGVCLETAVADTLSSTGYSADCYIFIGGL